MRGGLKNWTWRKFKYDEIAKDYRREEVIYACVHSGTKANSMGRIRASAEVEKVVLEKNGESGMGTWKAMVLKYEKD